MNIIVTGASKGIGKELVKLFTKDKKNKIFIISRNKEKLDQLIDECKLIAPGSSVISLPFDMTKLENLKELVNQIQKETECIDLLVNNAGFLVTKPYEKMTIQDVETIYKVNVLGPIEFIKQLIPLIKKGNNPQIINIGSMGGFQGSVKFQGLAIYASSKAAIASLTECLAEEYKDTNIRFNCLALGAVATEMLAEAFPGYKAPTTAIEMAGFIYNFALTASTMFNGKILPVSKTTP